MIWFTSDWHFNHDREFIWGPRGFSSVEEMNNEIIKRHNEIVTTDDTIYVLGDLMLGQDNIKAIDCIRAMKGHKIVICGNHDSNHRKSLYKEVLGLSVYDALKIKEQGYNLFLCHYPTLTANLEEESLKQCTINLFGHTHQQTNFYKDIPFMYHCGMDSHNCYPVSFDEAMRDIKAKVRECKDML